MNNRNWAGGLVVLMSLAGAAQAASYPTMLPHDQYLIADKAQEIALAKSAAPPSISDAAEVLILGEHGYETAVKGTNGFTCLVERSWDKPFDDPDFWNPNMRAPDCINAAATRTVLPIYMERAQWAMSGVSLSDMRERAKNSAKAKTQPADGAMAYMMSKDQHLNDGANPHWYPHVMFFTPNIDASAWGANAKGSPVLGASEADPVMLFFIPVREWSDGTLADYGPPADMGEHHH